MVRREPRRGVDMDVLQKVAGKPGWLTSHVVAMLFVAIASCGVAFSQSQRTGGPTPSAPGAEVYFIDLKDGMTVPPKLKIYFGLRNMGVAPAESDRENSGHHHLLIDTEVPPLDQPIPNDFNHLHFGAGQTETEITLKPGTHTLQLLIADKYHIPHTRPVMSALIRVRVVDPSARKSAPADARVYFCGVDDGSVLPQNATIRFVIVNTGVELAAISLHDALPIYLLIDTEVPPLDQPIPNDFNHLHFGAGQTEAIVTLSP